MELSAITMTDLKNADLQEWPDTAPTAVSMDTYLPL